MSDDDHSQDKGTALSDDGRVRLTRRPLPDRAHRIADDLAGIAHELREGNAGTSDQRLRLAAAIVGMRMLADDLREQLAAANDTTPSTAAAWEVDAYATRYTAYSTGAADDTPGWPPVDAMHTVVTELAAANERAEEATAKVARKDQVLSLVVAMKRRAEWQRDEAKEQVAELHTWRGLMTLLDEHYPADVQLGDPNDPGPRILALTREMDRLRAQLDALGEERVLMYRIIGAIEHAYALNTYVELEPGETAPTVESLWAEVRELRGVAPDAAADGHSATQAGGDRHGETTTTPDGTGTETTRA